MNMHTKYSRLSILISVSLLALLAACSPAEKADEKPQDALLIQNVSIVDGSGADAYPGAVRVIDGRIAAIGDLEVVPGDRVFDGDGKTLAPGFIDTHSHADRDLLGLPDALVAVSQGITTVVVGQDGGSSYPLETFFADILNTGVAINVASYAGHNTIRAEVMGDDALRPATAEEVAAMSRLLAAEMASGAIGFSTGLEYDSGINADPSEIITLAQVAADVGGRYISHVRSEDRWFEDALEEIINIGRVTGMPVQVSHIKLAMKRLWGQADNIIATMDAARAEGIDITADIYPYEFWSSNLMVLLPKRDYTDLEEIAMMLEEIAPPDGIRFTTYSPHPEYVGKTVADIAELRGIDAVSAFSQLAAESDAWRKEHGSSTASITGASMREDDIKKLLSWSETNVCTDGGLNYAHPRGAGSFTRILGRYVREQKLMSLETAIHKMTGLAAEHMGFKDRGVIATGNIADLVLFNRHTVIDKSTVESPQEPSEGIMSVWVHGEQVYADGKTSAARPGQVIRRN